jgi:hypothetical protein
VSLDNKVDVDGLQTLPVQMCPRVRVQEVAPLPLNRAHNAQWRWEYNAVGHGTRTGVSVATFMHEKTIRN